MLSMKYLGISSEQLPSEVHELDALLLAYEGVSSTTCQDPREPADHDWLDKWWTLLNAALSKHDEKPGLQVHTVTVSTLAQRQDGRRPR